MEGIKRVISYPFYPLHPCKIFKPGGGGPEGAAQGKGLGQVQPLLVLGVAVGDFGAGIRDDGQGVLFPAQQERNFINLRLWLSKMQGKHCLNQIKI